MKTCAIIGISGYGSVHLKTLLKAHRENRIRLIAAADYSPERARVFHEELKAIDCPLFRDVDEMFQQFSGRIDLCVVSTSIGSHAPYVRRALECGANVLVEKPLCATIQDVLEIEALERKHQRFVAVGFQSLYTEDTLRAKELILQGFIGSPRRLKCMAMWPRNSTYYDRNDWAGKMKSGEDWVLDSPLNNALSHYLQLMLFFAGTSLSSTAKPVGICAESYRAQSIENFDTGMVRVVTDEEQELLFYGTHACSDFINPAIIIEAEDGSMEWKIDGSETRFVNRNGDEEVIGHSPHTFTQENVLYQAIERLENSESFICTAEAAGAHVLCVNGIYESRLPVQLGSHWVETLDLGGEKTQTCIRNIEQNMRECYGAGMLPSEMGIPWALPGKSISLRDYAHFPKELISVDGAQNH